MAAVDIINTEVGKWLSESGTRSKLLNSIAFAIRDRGNFTIGSENYKCVDFAKANVTVADNECRGYSPSYGGCACRSAWNGYRGCEYDESSWTLDKECTADIILSKNPWFRRSCAHISAELRGDILIVQIGILTGASYDHNRCVKIGGITKASFKKTSRSRNYYSRMAKSYAIAQMSGNKN